MHLLTRAFLGRYPDRVVNVHPSLLPAFPGMHAVADALAAGVAETGVTVHLVDEGIDTGRVLAQERVAMRPEDTEATLLERLHAVEHRLLTAVARRLLSEVVHSPS
jgi:phosphoribosylglycinamide formyltransferase-1